MIRACWTVWSVWTHLGRGSGAQRVMVLRRHGGTGGCVRIKLDPIVILEISLVDAWSYRWSVPISSKLHFISASWLDPRPRDADGARTPVLQLCHRRCQYLANNVDSSAGQHQHDPCWRFHLAAHWLASALDFSSFRSTKLKLWKMGDWLRNLVGCTLLGAG